MAKPEPEKTDTKPLQRFSVLGLDTSALVSGNWPNPSVDLDNVVSTCRELGIPVMIPDLVLTEARVITLDKTAEAIQKASDALAQVEKRLPGVVDFSGVKWPSRKDRQNIYDAAVKELERRWGWVAVPVPDVPLRVAVERSARHEHPFATADTGFRDSVIVWSLLDSLKEGDEFGFIAGDTVLADKRVAETFTQRNIKLRVFKTAGEAWTVTESMARATALVAKFDEWEKLNDRLVQAIKSELERLEQYVVDHLTVPEVPFGVQGRILAVHAIRVGDVTSAHMPMKGPFEAHPDAEAEVEVKVEATINRYTPSPSRTLRVGEKIGDFPVIGTTETVVTEIDGHATLTLKVTWPEDEHGLPQVEYTGIEFGTAEQRLAQRLALIELMGGKRH